MHLEQIAVIVNDYDEAIQLFVEHLGFELREDSLALTNDGRPNAFARGAAREGKTRGR